MQKMNIEIKAKIENLEKTRINIEKLPSKYIAHYIQKDTYFTVQNGRLKLREIKGCNSGQLIYYNRQNISGPKKSNLQIIEIKEPIMLKKILEEALEIIIIVDKRRELFDYNGIRIHLDQVKNLGNFIELEKPTENRKMSINGSRKLLIVLMERLEIKKNHLIKNSYSDMLLKRC